MNCSQCQTPLAEGAQFCSACGAQNALGPAPVAAEKKSSKATCLIIAAVVAFVGLFLVGIVAAIAIPNLLSAIQRGKQQRTMGDMKTLGSAIESFNTDNNHYPTGDSLDELCKQLTPDYLATCIRRDGWGSEKHPQEFRYMAWEGEPAGCTVLERPVSEPPAVTADKGEATPGAAAPQTACGPQHYVIVSAGKDGIFQQNDPRNYPPGDTTSFNSDIVMKDGQFIRAPTGKQSNGPAN